jgi:hypothetical protein
MFRFRLSKHTQHASIYSEERQERRTRIRLPIPQAIIEKLFAPDWPGHVENEAEGPKTQKPNPCTRTTHTRNASAPSHDEFTSQQGSSGELGPARRSRRRRDWRRMRGRLGSGRAAGREGIVGRFGGLLGLAVPAAITWQLDLSVRLFQT